MSDPTAPIPPAEQPAPQPSAQPPRGTNGFAVVALIVAVVAFILGLIPFVGFISWVIAAGAIVVAIIALTRPRLPKGMAIAALIVGGVGLIAGPAVAIGSVVNAVSGRPAVQAEPAASATVAEEAPSASASTPAEDPTDVASEAPSDEASDAAAEPAVKTKTYKGSGDKVIKVDITDPVILTFTCSNCSSNTTLKTDSGFDTLPVNTIGSYKGTHLVNGSEGSLLTRMVIGANAAWTLKVEDVTSFAQRIKHVSVGNTITGSGDDVIYVDEGVTDSDVQNKGESNFVLKSYGGSDSLPVNEIGSYRGNVVLDGPAAVQVESDGDWKITGND